MHQPGDHHCAEYRDDSSRERIKLSEVDKETEDAGVNQESDTARKKESAPMAHPVTRSPTPRRFPPDSVIGHELPNASHPAARPFRTRDQTENVRSSRQDPVFLQTSAGDRIPDGGWVVSEAGMAHDHVSRSRRD